MAASATAAAAGNRDADCDAGSVVSSAQEVEVMSAPQNVLGLGIQKTLRKWQKPGGLWAVYGGILAAGNGVLQTALGMEMLSPLFSMGVTAASFLAIQRMLLFCIAFVLVHAKHSLYFTQGERTYLIQIIFHHKEMEISE